MHCRLAQAAIYPSPRLCPAQLVCRTLSIALSTFGTSGACCSPRRRSVFTMAMQENLVKALDTVEEKTGHLREWHGRCAASGHPACPPARRLLSCSLAT